MPTDAIYTTLRQMNYALDELEQTLARAEALHFEQIKKLQVEHEAALVAVRVQAQEQVQVQPPKTEPQPVAEASSPPSAKAKNGQSQSDLFANWTSGGNSPANDPKALILAKKLDSTIDKVQRLLAQAGA